MSLLAPVAFTSSKPAQQMAGWTEVRGGVPYFVLKFVNEQSCSLPQ
jgi:hypothetical protein